jgi:hypothetical protein
MCALSSLKPGCARRAWLPTPQQRTHAVALSQPEWSAHVVRRRSRPAKSPEPVAAARLSKRRRVISGESVLLRVPGHACLRVRARTQPISMMARRPVTGSASLEPSMGSRRITGTIAARRFRHPDRRWQAQLQAGAVRGSVLRLVHAAGHCISSYRTPLTMRIADRSHFAAAYTQNFESSARVAGL